MKIIAYLMLIIAGASAGVSAAMNINERVRILNTLCRFIRELGEAIRYKRKRLGEIISDIKTNSDFKECKIITDLDEALINEKGFNTAFNEAINKNPHNLKPKDRELLLSFGEGLGKSDVLSQQSHCEYFVQKLEDIISEAQDDAKKKGRLYVSLGTMAGIFAVIMFI